MEPDSLAYTKPFQLTKTIRRDPYDALSPSKPENSAAGKIILITGGGTGLGAVCLSSLLVEQLQLMFMFRPQPSYGLEQAPRA